MGPHIPNLSSQPAMLADAPATFQEAAGVLVVDDDHLVRAMVQLGLERAGFTIWTASDGREAIDIFRQHGASINLVLLDVRMPGLDGPHTLDVLRQLNPDVPVCFMRGDPADYPSSELIERGARHVLAKPFHLDELARILRRLSTPVTAS